MTTIGAFAAKTHFSALLQKAKNGEEITITYHGEPIAQIIPCNQLQNSKLKREKFINNIREIGQRNNLGEKMTLKELITEGRK